MADKKERESRNKNTKRRLLEIKRQLFANMADIENKINLVLTGADMDILFPRMAD